MPQRANDLLCYDDPVAKKTVIECDKCGSEDAVVKVILRQVHNDDSGWTERKDLCGPCTTALLQWFARANV